MKANCIICGRDIPNRKTRVKYCDACRDRVLKKHDYYAKTHQNAGQCIICGKPLEKMQKYTCSVAHYEIARNIVSAARMRDIKAERLEHPAEQPPKQRQLGKPRQRKYPKGYFEKRDRMARLDRDIAEAKRVGISYGMLIAQRHQEKEQEGMEP